MLNPVLHIFSSPQQLTENFVEFLYNKTRLILDKKQTINIGLSGGNTPKAVFRFIADNYNNQFPWSQIHFFWGDERCVPVESPESNYGEAKRFLFDHIEIPQKNLHFINGEIDPDYEAERYSKELLSNLTIKYNLPSLDINILGIGDDGHTASIFPNNLDLMTSEKICMVTSHTLTNQKRITLTGNVLNNSEITLFLISGKNKALVLKQIIQHQIEALNYPAYYINPDSGNLEYFLDQDAAALI